MAEVPNFVKKRQRAASVFQSAKEAKLTAESAVAQATAMAVEKKEKEKGGKGGEKGDRKVKNADILEELVKIISSLALQSAGELREICGILYTTCLVEVVPDGCIEAGIKAGTDYSDLVLDIKERKEQGEEGSDLEAGSPHISVAIETITKLIKEKKVQEDTRQDLLKWWEDNIANKEEEEVEKQILSFRVRKPKKQSKGRKGKVPAKEYAKVTFRLLDIEAGENLARAFCELGGIRKTGTAPKGTLEREALRLLQKFKK